MREMIRIGYITIVIFLVSCVALSTIVTGPVW